MKDVRHPPGGGQFRAARIGLPGEQQGGSQEILWHRANESFIAVAGGLFIGHSIVRCGLPFARFRCGDADAHLEGRCRCCGGHEQSMERHGTGEKCPTILERLRADVAALVKDFSALAGPLELAAMAKQSVELRRGVFLTASDLQQICESFERVDRAVVGFRRTCALLDLSSALKSAAPSCESAVSGSAPFSKMISHELGVTKETAPRA